MGKAGPLCRVEGCWEVGGKRQRLLCRVHYREWVKLAHYRAMFTRNVATEEITPPGWKLRA